MEEQKGSLGRPPLVVLVGEAALDHVRVAGLLGEGAVLVLSSDPGSALRWLDESGGRKAGEAPPPIRCGALEIDAREHRARWRGRPLPLTGLELRILAALARDPSRAWPFEVLFDVAWGGTYLGDAAPIRAAINRLRKKLVAEGVSVGVEAVRGFGFRLSVPGNRVETAEPSGLSNGGDSSRSGTFSATSS